MFHDVDPRSTKLPTGWLAPMALGLGLTMLAGAITWRLPALTGMALVSLGATVLTVKRFRCIRWMPLVLAAHSTIYGGLYALFVAATFPGLRVDVGTSLFAVADLATSLLVMTAAAGLVAAACSRPAGTEG